MGEDLIDGEARTWEIRVGVHTAEERARAVVEAIQRVLCPDPDHAPPCPVPWRTALLEADEDDPTLREQYEIERVPRAANGPGHQP